MSLKQQEHLAKNKQWLLALVLLSVFFIVVMVFVASADNQQEIESEIPTASKIYLNQKADYLDPQEEWQLLADSKLETLSKKLQNLVQAMEKQSLGKAQDELITQSVKQALTEQKKDFDVLAKSMSEQITQLKNKMAFQQEQDKKLKAIKTQPQSFDFLKGLTEKEYLSRPTKAESTELTSTIAVYNLELASQVDESSFKNEKSLKHYLPTGSYAKALILSGVSAAAAVRSKSEPRPILFRITSPAVTADHQTIDLKGCMVTGEAYGDVSSGRAFVRLHEMTCTSRERQVIETVIQGYAADRGTGLSGKVVRREGHLLSTAFWSGLFGGLGKSAVEANTSVSESPLGVVKSIKGKDIFAQALGQGVANAADRVSQYHIERAEQYHPVIEVHAGREVELVFIRGVYLDGRHSEAGKDDPVKSIKTKIDEVLP